MMRGSSSPGHGSLPQGERGGVLFRGDDFSPGPGNSARDVEGESSGAERAILLVDDELDSLEAIRELLESEGIRVWSAENGQEALNLLRQGKRPSLILLDLRMPQMDGWEFCRVIGSDEALAEIPVSIVTASAAFEKLPERRRDAGFFRKPIDFDAFLQVVKRYCG